MFYKATDGRFKRFCTVLKTASRLEGSRDKKGVQQSVAHDVESTGVFELFSNLGNFVNMAKSILSSIYTTLQAETSIRTCPPFFPLFFCQSFHLLQRMTGSDTL